MFNPLLFLLYITILTQKIKYTTFFIKKNKKNLKIYLTTKKKVSIINLVERTWSLSSAGRASALQAGGHRFEPCSDHHVLRPGSSVGQNASLSRQRSTVRARSGSPFFYMASQLSWQSRGLKILVSVVRFHLKPPSLYKMRV